MLRVHRREPVRRGQPRICNTKLTMALKDPSGCGKGEHRGVRGRIAEELGLAAGTPLVANAAKMQRNTQQPAKEPGRTLRKARKTLVEIDRLQQVAPLSLWKSSPR